jgi:hypothetical protein
MVPIIAQINKAAIQTTSSPMEMAVIYNFKPTYSTQLDMRIKRLNPINKPSMEFAKDTNKTNDIDFPRDYYKPKVHYCLPDTKATWDVHCNQNTWTHLHDFNTQSTNKFILFNNSMKLDYDNEKQKCPDFVHKETSTKLIPYDCKIGEPKYFHNIIYLGLSKYTYNNYLKTFCSKSKETLNGNLNDVQNEAIKRLNDTCLDEQKHL